MLGLLGSCLSLPHLCKNRYRQLTDEGERADGERGDDAGGVGDVAVKSGIRVRLDVVGTQRVEAEAEDREDEQRALDGGEDDARERLLQRGGDDLRGRNEQKEQDGDGEPRIGYRQPAARVPDTAPDGGYDIDGDEQRGERRDRRDVQFFERFGG